MDIQTSIKFLMQSVLVSSKALSLLFHSFLVELIKRCIGYHDWWRTRKRDM